MSLTRRYSGDDLTAGGRVRGTPTAAAAISQAARRGNLSLRLRIIEEGERLDSIAGEEYGDSRLWWIIAAASGIGYGLQVPPGTRLLLPDLNQVRSLVG